MSVFSELKRICPPLASPACDALETITDDPSRSLENIERHVTSLTQTILAFEGLAEPATATQIARLNVLNNRGYLPTVLHPFFHALERYNHGSQTDTVAIRMSANLHLKLAVHLTIWFCKAYGPYLPSNAAAFKTVEELFQDLRSRPPDDSIRRAARKVAMRRAATITLAEDETRVIIDYQLRSAGWQADTVTLRHSLGTRPEKGVNKAIAEWQTETGPADYALFAGLDFIGVVEAKKMGKDVVADLTQGKRYAERRSSTDRPGSLKDLGASTRCPFSFRPMPAPILSRLKEKSGIWFLDVA